MPVKAGTMCDAQQLFYKSCYSLTTGCIKHDKQHNALTAYCKFQEDGSLTVDGQTFVTLLQACAKLKDVEIGLKLHAQVVEVGFLERNRFIGSTLVDMYAKCGFFAKAQQVFNKLPMRDVVVWTTLISGYAEHGHGEKALKCFEEMQLEGLVPNDVTFVCSLKACGTIGAVDEGRQIHAEIERRGLLESSPFLGSALVDMYAKFGSLTKAQQVFNRLSIRNEVLWNVLIAVYAGHGHAEKALTCFKQMQIEGFTPNSVTFVCTLKACASIAAADKGREVHIMIERQGLLESDLVVGSTLVDTYAKCGLLARAQQVFDKLPVRNVVSWTALMAGYAERGHGVEVINCFERMQSEGIYPNAVTYVCCLKACSSIGFIDKGKELHAEIERQDILLKDLSVGNTLVDMYAKCGLLAVAQEVFSKLPNRTVVSWTALIAGYAEHGHSEEALKCFDQMQFEGISPNAVTLVCTLKACGSIKAVEKGQEIHAEIKRQGLERDLVVGNTLVDMYIKCGTLVLAQQVFDNLPVRSVVSWTALVTGYTEHGQGEEAFKCYEKMRLEGISPDAIAYVWLLKACSSIGAMDKGEVVHAELERQGLLERDLFVGNTLVDMYSKCGSLVTAQQVFNKLPVKDVVTWTALISGYAEHGLGEEALKCFEKLQSEGVSTNAVLYVLVLRACSSIGALDKGEELHAEAERQGFLEGDLVVGNTLVDMYAKCSSLTKAQQVFDKLLKRDVVSWTSLMVGYTQHGESENVFCIYDRMLGEGIKPDPVIFVVVLNACSRTGLFKESQTYIEAMGEHFGVAPSIKHQTCVIDLLSRTGQVDKAVALIEKNVFSSNLVVWRTVLGACKHWGNLEFGKKAFKQAVCLNEKDYVSTSQVYAGADLLQEEVAKVSVTSINIHRRMDQADLWLTAD